MFMLLKLISFMIMFMFRCAVLGAGFAGLSVAWHLLDVITLPLPICV